MRNVYLPIGAVLSFLLMPTGAFPNGGTPGDQAPAAAHVIATAQQLAQEESNDSDANPQADQPENNDSSASNDNSDQPSAQPGDENEGSSQASSSDENLGEPQMNPEDTDSADQSNQNPADQQNPQDSTDTQ